MKKILIVDDSEFARRLLKKSIKALFEKELILLEAQNGNEALEFAKNEHPDLMFLDLTMPIMDGYEVLKHMKSNKIVVPTIVISADVQTKAQERVAKLGVLGFLKKPHKPEDLRKLLRELKQL